jgi:hypothetical protein
MQDRYVGDAGDFGKYGLLRFLCDEGGPDPLKLAVVWYFVPSRGSAAADGKHVGYLKDLGKRYRCCDDELFDTLVRLLIDPQGKLLEANRRVELVETSGILRNAPIFYRNPLFLNGARAEERRKQRQAWVEGALKETEGADLVFLDPDNGIECASATHTGPTKGPKYVFWDEILGYTKRGQSVVVYHHLNRSMKHEEQVKGLRQEFERGLPDGFTCRALVFRRGTARAFLIGISPQHRDQLNRRISAFMSAPWREHFEESK